VASVRALDHESPAYLTTTAAYLKRPGAWKALNGQDLELVDPWFWVTDSNWPRGQRSPLRVGLDCSLNIPADGDYAFGASAGTLTTIRVDGKTVFQRDGSRKAERAEAAKGLPAKAMYDEAERRGVLGAPLRLAQGEHRLEIEEVMFNQSPGFAMLLRPIWKAPGREAETLPLEMLSAPRR
jgi:hypothetical protein